MTDLARLLSFAARSRVPGGFGYAGDDGTVLPDRPVETWITARMTHVFGLATILGDPGAAELAAHGVAELRDGPLHDAEHGGWRAATDDDTKAAYVHAFAVLAGATSTAAGVPGGRELLDEALGVWEQRFWDDDEGLARESFDRSWTTPEDYRGANANMHGVEAALAAADALAPTDPGTAARLRTHALRATERIVHGWARERDWRLPEHFTSTWEPLPEFNRDRPADPFRPYGITIGHQFEWARLCLHLAAALGEHAPGWLHTDADRLFLAAAERGWAADGHEGFPYTLDWADRPVVGARMHWVVCEAVAAAAVRYAVTGDPRALTLQRRWAELGERRFLDPAVGSWHHELTPEGAVGTGTWAGKPDAYHLVQMLLLPGRPVRGSVIGALLAAPQGA
ncbi:AGE family epimerase/isomerase [Modestobacter versicolor]|uniref:AGE family epimerase/isomerase n=1 Tax=Modestobacter versicolor TaxID=429133 RepID=A0A323V964_9ACTN|nr:AGE family epimerase/isomerase [Modestobacter versicolor]MBB3677714.1 mannose/cellobiose epimerase-like protein (N-acyl-D-glucosamine 2-epimerase family) [Modestobacter versicolor]PZA21289.1 AGE family epimerase/isomerase [Modestobacter versicolor]